MTWVVSCDHPTFASRISEAKRNDGIKYPAAKCDTVISGSARILGISSGLSIFFINW